MVEEDLSVASITNNLQTTFIGQRVLYYTSLTSTNEVAKREARLGAIEGTVVIADEQTQGKGRIKRLWLSPKGSIALSVILYPSLVNLPSLIMLASLAVINTIGAVTGLKSQIKWPNDILLDGRKVCGILIENSVRGITVDYAIVGIGINVNLRLSDFPAIVSTATSLSEELNKNVPRLNIIRSLFVEMERLYLKLQSGQSLYEEWRDNLVTLGKKIQVKSGEIIYEGIAEAANRNGSLLLRCPDGSLTEIVAGDATLHINSKGGREFRKC